MIKILDVTLRDGGRAINYNWGESAMRDISSAVAESGCDLIELGCLRPNCHEKGRSLYTFIEEAEQYVDSDSGAEYTLMIDYPYPPQYDISDLRPYNGGKLKHIRTTFKEGVNREVFEYVQKIVDKGYNLHINLTCFPGYSKDERLRMLEEVNRFGVHNVTLADTYGILNYPSLLTLLSEAHQHLDQSVCLGLHLHDNSLSAYVLAQVFMQHYGEKRNIILDASIGGLGKTSGNPRLEMLMGYVNENHGGNYDISNLLDIESKYIFPGLKQVQKEWDTFYYALAAGSKAIPSLAQQAMRENISVHDFYDILHKK